MRYDVRVTMTMTYSLVVEADDVTEANGKAMLDMASAQPQRSEMTFETEVGVR